MVILVVEVRVLGELECEDKDGALGMNKQVYFSAKARR